MHKVLAVLGLSLLASAFAHADTVYNVVSDFSTASNPNGVWTYGYGSGSSSTPFAFTAFTTSGAQWGGQGNYAYWSTNVNGVPVVGHNTTGGPSGSTFNVPTTSLWMLPGAGADAAAIVMFTAPINGNYSVNAFFERDDSSSNGNGVLTDIFLNGRFMEEGTLTELYGSEGLGMLLNAGDQLAFIVNSRGDPYDSVGARVTATVTPFGTAPEPSSVWLLATGALGVGGAVRWGVRA